MSDIVERLRNYIPGEHDKYVPEVNALAIAEIERLRAAIETVAKTFEKDREQGFRTRDKEYAITILRAAVPGAAASY